MRIVARVVVGKGEDVAHRRRDGDRFPLAQDRERKGLQGWPSGLG